MRTKGLFLAVFVAFLFIGTQSALAQTRTADMNLTVTANNVGIFTCSLTVNAFDFGDVDADGNTTTPGVTGARILPADDGATYNAAGVSAWTCRAAPASTVDFTIESGASDHTGGLDPDRLEVQMVEGGTGGGFADFTSGATLLSGISVGNGANQATGTVDLRLSVMDVDPTGLNTWNVVLRATGSP